MTTEQQKAKALEALEAMPDIVGTPATSAYQRSLERLLRWYHENYQTIRQCLAPVSDEARKLALEDLDYIAECCPHDKGTVLGNRFDRVRQALSTPSIAEVLAVARRDINNWVTHDDARISALEPIDKCLAKYRESKK